MKKSQSAARIFGEGYACCTIGIVRCSASISKSHLMMEPEGETCSKKGAVSVGAACQLLSSAGQGGLCEPLGLSPSVSVTLVRNPWRTSELRRALVSVAGSFFSGLPWSGGRCRLRASLHRLEELWKWL